jgi:hypothetical protein
LCSIPTFLCKRDFLCKACAAVTLCARPLPPSNLSRGACKSNSGELGSLAVRRVFVPLFFFLLLYYLAQGSKHLEREAHYAAVLTSTLEVESFIVIVGEHFGDESLVVVKTLRPSWDGFVVYLLCLLTHLAHSPPLIRLMCALCRLFQTFGLSSSFNCAGVHGLPRRRFHPPISQPGSSPYRRGCNYPGHNRSNRVKGTIGTRRRDGQGQGRGAR